MPAHLLLALACGLLFLAVALGALACYGLSVARRIFREAWRQQRELEREVEAEAELESLTLLTIPPGCPSFQTSTLQDPESADR